MFSSKCLHGLLALAQLSSFAAAGPNCPLLGPEFPPPRKLSSNPIWKQALANITGAFTALDTSNTTGMGNFSYSIQIFSTNPGSKPVLWERYRTAPNLPANTTGVKTVDGDTVYRLGSVSKVFAVLTFLVEAGDMHWNSPITQFVPELKRFEGRTEAADFDPVRETPWDDITVGSLAGQISGIGRDYGVLGEITQTDGLPPAWLQPFPVLNETQKPPCGTNPLCNRQQFFTGLDIMYPSYPAWQAATYSNIAYQLLAYALENISGKNFTEILSDRILKPLNMTRTYYESAPESVGILPAAPRDVLWYASLGEASPGGNMYASAGDLSTFGRAILSSTLLKPARTRRWLQPMHYTSDLRAAVGAPWGIRRIAIGPADQPHRSLSAFTKAGTFNTYTAFLTLLRDFNLGLTIMMAGQPVLNNFATADFIAETLLPAYEAASRAEANDIYSGKYVARGGDGTANGTAKSTLVIDTGAGKPGLGIKSWTVNGTNMISAALKLQSGLPFEPARGEARLYYTQLDSAKRNSTAAAAPRRQAWKAIFEDTGHAAPSSRPFSTDCGSWVGVTGVTYGSLPLDEFVFLFGDRGQVVGVENLALRTTYLKV